MNHLYAFTVLTITLIGIFAVKFRVIGFTLLFLDRMGWTFNFLFRLVLLLLLLQDCLVCVLARTIIFLDRTESISSNVMFNLIVVIIHSRMYRTILQSVC